jgi:hypothetical protein
MNFMIGSGTDTLAVPIHDGLEATEVTLDTFNAFNNGDIAISGTTGYITILKDIDLSQTILQIAVEKTGASISKLSMWTETSFNSGATWTNVEDSLNSVSISDECEGIHTFELSFIGNFPAGSMHRFKLTNSGGGNLSVEPPTALVTSKGSLEGKSAKISLMYRRAG